MAGHELEKVDCQDLVEELADRMELDGEEREKFVDRCMTRAGYTATSTWVPPDGKEHGSGSGSGSGESETHERRSRGWFPNE